MPLPLVPIVVGTAVRWIAIRAIPYVFRFLVRWLPTALRWGVRHAGTAVRWGLRAGRDALRWGVRRGGDALRWGLRAGRAAAGWGLRFAISIARFGMRLALPLIRLGRYLHSFRLVRWGLRLLRLLPGVTRMLGALGVIQDQITIKLQGGPRSSLKYLFKVAAGIAFGKVKRLVPAGGGFPNPFPPPVRIGVHYALERRELELVVIAEQSLIAATAFSGVGAVESLPVFSGPSMTSKAADWDFEFLVGAIKPVSLADLAGKVMLTDSPTCPDPITGVDGPSKSYRPTGDARSRGTLVRMVTAALANPVQQGPSTFGLPTEANRFTGG